jgi:hypothetical protein
MPHQPGFPTVVALRESEGAAGEDDIRLGGMGEHLVDVRVDIDRGVPGGSCAGGSRDPADVDVDV